MTTILATAASSTTTMVVYLIVMAAMLIFLFYLPNKRQAKRDNEMRNSLEIGDEVTTTGGIVGRVVALKDDTFVLETGSDRVRIRFRKSAIAAVEKLRTKLFLMALKLLGLLNTNAKFPSVMLLR